MTSVLPATDDIQSYYDDRVAGKLRDFTDANPRIEAAVQLIAEWAPPNPRRVLEIGCGVGHTAWRMGRAWPRAEVIGTDISPQSIEVAKTCFQLPNLFYRVGPLAKSVTEDGFDLVVMTDVYEHIAQTERPALHAAIRSLMSCEARLIMTVPTPALQESGWRNSPTDMQPIDEDISISDLNRLAEDVEARLIYYREVGIWRYGDYFHAVLARGDNLNPVALRQLRQGGGRALLRRLLGMMQNPNGSLRDHLGADVLRPFHFKAGDKFKIGLAGRRRLAARWADHN